MKVVHVFKDYYPPTTGGIEQHMRLLCTGLAAHAEVTVLVPSRSRRTIDERVDGVRVIRVAEFGRVASVPLTPTLPRHLARLRPDVVHLHFPNPAGDLGYLLAARNEPLVVSYHADIVRQRALLPFYRPVLRLLFGRTDRILVASPDYVESSPLLSRYRDRCTIVPYGVDLAALELRDGESAEVARLRRAHGGRLVLFVGVLRYYKGVPVLLRAMTKVQGHLIVAGRGPDLRALHALANELKIADRTSFLGEVSPSALRVLLHACDVFVLPSIDRSEAFGIAQLEAMACGTPVVSTDLPTGVRFVNRHSVTGFLAPPGDIDALAGALSRLLNDRALLERFGRAARQRVEEEFRPERMIARTLEVYHELRAQCAGPADRLS